MAPPQWRLQECAQSFQVMGQDGTGPVLVVEKESGKVSRADAASPATHTPRTINGIVGLFEPVAGVKFFVVITAADTAADVAGSEVWAVRAVDCLPLHRADCLTEVQADNASNLLALFRAFFTISGIYFCAGGPECVLTNSLASRTAVGKEAGANAGAAWWNACDTRFFWNRHLTVALQTPALAQWLQPLTVGFVGSFVGDVNGSRVCVALVSRRNMARAGTRFNVRGVDSNGDVANNVESEQVVALPDGRVFAFVQTRGSVPVQWSQQVNLKYTPPIRVSNMSAATIDLFKRHMEGQQARYGRQVVVNLINQHGSESRVGDAYKNHFPHLSQPALFRYVDFDFHKECSKMRWGRLSLLMEQVRGEFDAMGYTCVQGGAVKRAQAGVFRTNCMDNLDRTNVVQTMFAREALARQLHDAGLIDDTAYSNGVSASLPALEAKFKHMWADNADMISLQYSGTGALKNDFTRTGVRNWRGALNDGVNSITRYYLNNFRDGTRQDSYNVFCGQYELDPDEPFLYSAAEKHTAWGVVFALVGVFAAVQGAVVLSPESSLTSRACGVVLFLAALLLAYRVSDRGAVLIDRPRFLKE
eukprot:CAMPEP_0177648260 /NCGR_PEP_ID=MMETSP0447-20121125/10736_1 /TAXON_ID=0 /ORGANISM="Stygamoeba regulata, Strain BSH-02190019" /LENGTH=588 /DNA_ID=CAMNT_0019150895 /DNA_START=40 /DNA_END=1806 /DNA_ORIENTATION=+